MNLERLNPSVNLVTLFEKVNRSDICVSYSFKIIYLISGELSCSVYEGCDGSLKEKKIRMSSGNLLLIPCGVRYSLRSKYLSAIAISFTLSDSDKEGLTTVNADDFDASLLNASSTPAPFDKAVLIEDFTSEKDNLVKMSSLFTAGEGNYLAQLSARVKLLLLKIANLCDDSALPPSMIDNLHSYIEENISEEISNTELGAIFGYHPFYISRMLKEKRGITLHQYIISYRLRKVKQLLRFSNSSVSEIAEKTGFTDASYLTKIFKNHFSMTPKEYRNLFKDEFI